MPAIKYDNPIWHRTLLLARLLKIQWQNLTTHTPGKSALRNMGSCLIDLHTLSASVFHFIIPKNTLGMESG